MTTLHSAAQSPAPGQPLLSRAGSELPWLPSSALPARWAQGHWEDETGEVPACLTVADSRFNSRVCTVTPGKTLAGVYSFCEDP